MGTARGGIRRSSNGHGKIRFNVFDSRQQRGIDRPSRIQQRFVRTSNNRTAVGTLRSVAGECGGSARQKNFSTQNPACGRANPNRRAMESDAHGLSAKQMRASAIRRAGCRKSFSHCGYVWTRLTWLSRVESPGESIGAVPAPVRCDDGYAGGDLHGAVDRDGGRDAGGAEGRWRLCPTGSGISGGAAAIHAGRYGESSASDATTAVRAGAD